MAAIVSWPAVSRHGGVVREYSLSGPDPSRVLPGPITPPGPVDSSGLGFVVSSLARTDREVLIRHRQLLAVVTIGMWEKAWLRGIRQYASVGGNTAGFPAFVEQEIVGPAWAFSDTYMTWHVSWAPGVNSKRILDAGSAGIDGYDGFSAYGTFYDLRFPWRDGGQDDLDAPVGGPGTLLMWVEFTQSDPARRPQRSPGPPGAFTDPDNQFTQMQYPGSSVYRRVAGALRVEHGLVTDPSGH